MKRKFLLISTLLIVLLSITASTVFANNALNTIGNVAEDVTSAAGNVLTTGVDAVRNTVDDVANGTMRASNNVPTVIIIVLEMVTLVILQQEQIQTQLGLEWMLLCGHG